MAESYFTNELGNEIRVAVAAHPLDGVAGVLITIEGPTSLCENHVTRVEADALLRALVAQLRPDLLPSLL